MTWKEVLDLWALASVQVFGMFLTLAALALFWLANHSRENPFDAAQMFQDENNKTSSSKFLMVVGGLAMTWVVIYLAVQGKLDAGVFATYIFAVVLGKVGTEIAARMGDRNEDRDGK